MRSEMAMNGIMARTFEDKGPRTMNLPEYSRILM